VAWLSAERRDDGLVGIDLAGNEAEFRSDAFYGIFREARQSGLHITIHAGEWGPAANVREAIEELSAERIGHGVRVLEDPVVVALARERRTPFEICVTSNHQSGVVPTPEAHPLGQMLECGLNATIHTDDPSVSRITLSNEYETVCEVLGLSQGALEEMIVAAGEAAFLPEAERDALVARRKAS
jgi:adenosine deaminase